MGANSRAVSLRKEKAALRVVEQLQKAGFQALFAGGCVRDTLMGREPEDFDVATNAEPGQVTELFDKTLTVGAHFGVVVVVSRGENVEVATFRQDDEYVDGRRPKGVRFTDARGDALRRDFTVNGLFTDPVSGEVIDYVGGQQDIEKRLIRAIGEPAERFEEDRLRMLRAIRFACTLGFEIEAGTFEAIKDHARKIESVSAERIAEELRKILMQEGRHIGIRLMQDAGLNDVILPEVSHMVGVPQPDNFHPEGDVFEHTLLALSHLKHPSFELAMAVLLHDVGKPGTFQVADRIRFSEHESVGAQMAREICQRLKLSNSSTDRIHYLVKRHMMFKDVEKMRLSKLKRLLGDERFSELAELHRVDALACKGDLSYYNFCMAKLAEFGEERTKPIPLLNGRDLITLGLEPGPIFSTILDRVHEEQLEETIRTKEEALARAREIARQCKAKFKSS